MNKNTKKLKATDFSDYLEQQLRDREIKKHYQTYGKQLELAYQILQLRKKSNISQKELAKKIGTTQSNVARMEGGRQNFTVETLEKIARTFNKGLTISIR